MILSKVDLETFIEKSKHSNLEVVDGKLIAHKKYKVDVLTYILNKYDKLREIRFFWESSQKNIKTGVILVINISMPFTVGLVTIKNNKIIISMDGFIFEDDTFNEYILKCNTVEENEGYIKNDLFGFLHVKSKISENLVVLNINRGGKSLHFETTSYFETTDNVTLFKIRNCYNSKTLFNTNEIERFRMNYFDKIREIEKRINICAAKLELVINFKTGRFHFYTVFNFKEGDKRKFLEYLDYNYRRLNYPLYYSVIGVAEEFLSDTYQSTVILNNEETVQRYLDLDNMITI